MQQSAVNGKAPVREITVLDTTLRDGEQAPGNGMTAEHKLEMALRLENLGVDLIEVGFPASSANDFAAAKLVGQAIHKATVATFCRAVETDISTAVEAVGIERHQVQILATASELHLAHKRGIDRADAVRETAAAVRFAASLGVTNISVGLEDASRGTPELLRPLVESSITAGATTIAVCDTSGCLTPSEFGDLIAQVRSWMPDGAILSTHCHDDMGLALANALAGIQAGADEVQTTLAGVGERAGNTALEELATVLTCKGDQIGAATHIDTKALYETYLALKSMMRLEGIRNKAIFGENAFATQAGIHQAGLLQKPETYEYLEPSNFGRERSILVGRHSGRAILRHLLEQQHVSPAPELVGRLYDEFIGGRTDNNVETLDAVSTRLSQWIADHSELAGAVTR
jgi:2-isopropylmalate synthase